MRRSLMRLIGTVVLAGWLFPLALPALCDATPRAADVECEQPMAPVTPGLDAIAGASHDLPCMNPALCGVPTTAVATRVVQIGSAPLEFRPFFTFASFDAGAARAPLSPPPQA
jgi:hypothetical protein